MSVVLKQALSNDIEQDYSKYTLIEHRKKYAQFFTPPPIARFMAKWLLGNVGLDSVLEPAFGLGIFSRYLLSEKSDLKIKGFEVDENILDQAKTIFDENENVQLTLQDYISSDWETKYDGIICNPPYFKFHNYNNISMIEEVESKLCFKLNGFTNLYTLFLLKSIYQLNFNGRAAYIIPSEFLNSDYGKFVKSFLIQSKSVRHIIVINFEENVFEDALTTASIILCSNDLVSNRVHFSVINKLSDLGLIEYEIAAYPKYFNGYSTKLITELKPEIKWKAYYQEQNSLKYNNLVSFSKYGKVVRGIATGANDYFTFNKSKAGKHNIDTKYLLPCICKAMDVKNACFSVDDFNALAENDKFCYLLNVMPPIDQNISNYLNSGLEKQVDKKFLTGSRNPWFALEKRLPAPIWVSVFNRTGLKFIRNEANIANLTTFHCIYPVNNELFGGIDIDLFFAYLLTETAKEIFNDNCREYGNGLQKFEPNDINKAKMFDLQKIDKATEKIIISYYLEYRKSIICSQIDESYIKKINKIFLEHFK